MLCGADPHEKALNSCPKTWVYQVHAFPWFRAGWSYMQVTEQRSCWRRSHLSPTPIYLSHSWKNKLDWKRKEKSRLISLEASFTVLQRIWQREGTQKYLIRKRTEETLAYHFVYSRWANIRKLKKQSGYKQELSHAAHGNVPLVQLF